MQIIPAIFACSGLWLSVWLLATIIFGRLYCSTVCPSGAMMDLSALLFRSRKTRFSYKQTSSRLRTSFFVILLICFLFGFMAVIYVCDPYSAFARIVVAIARPVAIGLSGITLALITLLAISYLAYRRGRIICNTICPVGTMLGCVSRISLYHADINTDLCTNCGRCNDVCPAECIDLKDHVVDVSRCVVCFDCMSVCPDSAITYRRGRHQLSIPLMQRADNAPSVSATNKSRTESETVKTLDRRKFIAATAISVFGTIEAVASKVNEDYVSNAVRLTPLNYPTPPGATSHKDFLKRCTACGACISACPTSVLTGSTNQYGLRHSLVPILDFDRAFCSFDCVKCTGLCPTNALRPLTLSEKRTSPIGRARVNPSNCMLYVNGTNCNVCVKVCPKRAVSIILDANSRKVPIIEPELCIGCGKCSHFCPSEPYSAIVIEGL